MSHKKSTNITAVVHIVRKGNPPSAFNAFLESYLACSNRTQHELLVILKGFHGEREYASYIQRLKGLDCRLLLLPDTGLDLGAYRLAAKLFTHFDRMCFLNSFSVIKDPQFLDKMMTALTPDVGVVGVSGSWESMTANPARLGLFKRTIMPLLYQPWPNPHIRTNAFLMRRDVMLAVWPRWFVNRSHTHVFESGRRSLTRRVQQLGLQTVVVGRDGKAYQPEDWPLSGTFRAAHQSNLMVGDNQTRRYAEARPDERAALEAMAWRNSPAFA